MVSYFTLRCTYCQTVCCGSVRCDLRLAGWRCVNTEPQAEAYAWIHIAISEYATAQKVSLTIQGNSLQRAQLLVWALVAVLWAWHSNTCPQTEAWRCFLMATMCFLSTSDNSDMKAVSESCDGLPAVSAGRQSRTKWLDGFIQRS